MILVKRNTLNLILNIHFPIHLNALQKYWYLIQQNDSKTYFTFYWL